VLGSERVALVDAAAVSGVASHAPVETLEAVGMIKADRYFGVTVRVADPVLLDDGYRRIPGEERRRLTPTRWRSPMASRIASPGARRVRA